MNTIRPRPRALVLAVLCSVGATLAVVHTVRAIGIPGNPAMYYRGTLDEAGVAVTGSRSLTLRLMSAAGAGSELCTTGASTVTVTNGAFELPLPEACTEAIRTRPGVPDVWLELSVEGTVVGPRTRLGAVPYAIVADRAGNAEGALATEIAAIRAQNATLAGQVSGLMTQNAMMAAQITTLTAENPDCPRGYARDMTASPGVVCARMVLGLRDEVVKVGTGNGAFWIDRFEASVHQNTPGGMQLGVAFPVSPMQDNLPTVLPRNGQRSPGATPPIVALSHPGPPSVNVTWFQANEACIAAGKRLPRGSEWLAAASGTPDTSVCNGVLVTSSARAATASGGCVSAAGAHDMIGNVWEWTDEWYAGVGTMDVSSPTGTPATDGWPIEADLYRGDGTWNIASSAVSGSGGTRRAGIPSVTLRGGDYNDGPRAGVFTMSLTNAPSAWHSAIGLRCVISAGIR